MPGGVEYFVRLTDIFARERRFVSLEPMERTAENQSETLRQRMPSEFTSRSRLPLDVDHHCVRTCHCNIRVCVAAFIFLSICLDMEILTRLAKTQPPAKAER